jgi:hypothetical protein
VGVDCADGQQMEKNAVHNEMTGDATVTFADMMVL